MIDENFDSLLDSALDDFVQPRALSNDNKTRRPPRLSAEDDPLGLLSEVVESRDFTDKLKDEEIVDHISPIVRSSSASVKEPKGLGFDPLRSSRLQSTRKKKTTPVATGEYQQGNDVDQELSALMAELMKAGGLPSENQGGPNARNFEETLAALANQAENQQNGAQTEGEDQGAFDFLQGLGGGTPDMNALVDSMMEHLLSKDVLYPPLKEIADQYPDWLERNQPPVLSLEDYQRYQTQYSLIQQLLQVYETTNPVDYSQVMDLLQKMQESGQPPSELVKDMAPGMETGPDGLPQMPSTGLPPELAQQCIIA